MTTATMQATLTGPTTVRQAPTLARPHRLLALVAAAIISSTLLGSVVLGMTAMAPTNDTIAAAQAVRTAL